MRVASAYRRTAQIGKTRLVDKENPRIKKTLVATSQQGEIETPKAETPPNTSKYARFDKWNKRELCDKIFELESERDDLLKEIQTLKSGQNEESPFSGGLFAKRNLSRGLASLSGGSV